MGYLYILGTVVFTTYGQLILKWQIAAAGAFPSEMIGKLLFLFRLLVNPWVISAWIGAFLAAMCWMSALTKFDLSYAYPFMSLSFVLVIIFSACLFQEPVNLPKVLGIILIVAGISISFHGQ